MRWSVIRLIAAREIRDQFRDRRTLFLILGLPVLMYPLFVGVGVLFVTALKEKKLVVGVVGAEYLPQPKLDVNPNVAAIAGVPAGLAYCEKRAFPPLIVNGKFRTRYIADEQDGAPLSVKFFGASDEDVLAKRHADTLLIIEPDFMSKLERGERPVLRVTEREGEENSKLAVRRLLNVLRKWEDQVKAARFAQVGLAPDFDIPIEIKDPLSDKPLAKKVFDELRDGLVKVIPFLLMMWMLTGAIYPAIDMTAGEKERGTMETLLISPAERVEIVMGKFAAVVTMGFGTAIWNVFLMLFAVAIAPLLAPTIAGQSLLSLPGLAACVLAAIPLAMLIAACGLTLGIFARSTKEGNYYMVPMFFVALPLSYLSMSPGIELDGATSWIPVTNALLLQQRLLGVRPDAFPWQHVPAVIASLSLCISISLWTAIRQFHRESVLFREAQAGRRKWSLFGRSSQQM
jgi:sodium transport system permease protein